MSFENQYPTQSLGHDEDEDEVEVQETEVIKGKKGKHSRDRWIAEEDKPWVSGYLNCFVIKRKEHISKRERYGPKLKSRMTQHLLKD